MSSMLLLPIFFSLKSEDADVDGKSWVWTSLDSFIFSSVTTPFRNLSNNFSPTVVTLDGFNFVWGWEGITLATFLWGGIKLGLGVGWLIWSDDDDRGGASSLEEKWSNLRFFSSLHNFPLLQPRLVRFPLYSPDLVEPTVTSGCRCGGKTDDGAVGRSIGGDIETNGALYNGQNLFRAFFRWQLK